MGTVVKTRIIKIGNSHGIRIPKLFIDHLGLTEEVQLEVQQDQLIIRSKQSPRQGWDDQFRKMAERGDDPLLDADFPSLANWDSEEWEW
jgi:antitoxin MazE